MHFRHTLLAILGLVLFAAATLVVVGAIFVPERTFRDKVSSLLPSVQEVPGWTVKYPPLADTVEMQKAIDNLLNYDDAAYVTFSKGDIQISIYLSYWTPGKMSFRGVAAHTPDTCWVAAGWKCLSRGTARFALSAAATDPLLMEQRTFQLGARVEHVIFSHFVLGQAKGSGGANVPTWRYFMAGNFQAGLKQRKEQLFLRISSNRPLMDFENAEPVAIVRERLARMIPEMERLN